MGLGGVRRQGVCERTCFFSGFGCIARSRGRKMTDRGNWRWPVDASLDSSRENSYMTRTYFLHSTCYPEFPPRGDVVNAFSLGGKRASQT